ncbi:hypothetical protein [Rhodococcus jostii]|uniref:hypothetical protein n=1 Tax=Rhodococcus jostii TaxID=132919 RepID=UPI003658798B
MSARKQEQLWPELTVTVSAPLSTTYANPSYRASAQEKPKWTPVKVKAPIPCDECAAVQHETRGRFGPRASARQRRGFVGGPILRLCTRHANAWRERDTRDGA